MFKALFGRAVESSAPDLTTAHSTATAAGMRYQLPGVEAAEWLAAPFAHGGSAELGACLAQLFMDGYGQRHEDHVLLPWRDLYAALSDPNHASAAGVLSLPPFGDHRPMLTSRGSISDSNFAVILSHWVDERGAELRRPPSLTGAVIRIDDTDHLLQQPVWELLEQLRQFHETPAADRTTTVNERAWARMRRWAIASHAPMSDYLEKTVVVTPEKLKLQFRTGSPGADGVMEAIPTIEGVPPGWLAMFDRTPVQDSYSVPDGHSMTKVVLSEPVKATLQEIKRSMPGRRVAGSRAEAFVRNPVGLLGPAAAEAIDPQQVEQALADAGIATQRFIPDVRRSEQGLIESVLLLVDTLAGENQGSEDMTFADTDHLSRFCERLASRIAAGNQCCAWEGYDLEIVSETQEHLAQLQAWLAEWRQVEMWSASELFDLSHYSDRIAEIGVERAYCVPFAAKRSVELDWFVENVLFGVAVRPPGSTQSTLLTLTADDLAEVQAAIDQARETGSANVELPGAPFPVPLMDTERALQALQDAQEDIAAKAFDPAKPRARAEAKPERVQLVIKSNIDTVEHAEARADLLALPPGTRPRLPRTLLPTVQLKHHQHDGVAWLQHLWKLSPASCRGALLADDMGLGKTVQLLTFIASCIEQDPALDPVLVVAPLALLENWRAEVEKFFVPGSLPLLTLYGKSLAALRVGKQELDPQLAQHGISKLLRRDWIGSARIVLTTYETMRDLEFTLAAQSWSIMVCDEAQRIKNPGAMVTRTAKKQKVRFRIACTGTPVENTLMDLWCLFDFIQPGLLGALNQFSRTYRQPIEAKTDEQKARVEELRDLIKPQTLRRTKQEVARDILPRKLEDSGCRALPMSDQQVSQYWTALEEMKKQRGANQAAKLMALHHIRRICSDPHWQQHEQALKMPLPRLTAESPKLRWLIDRLEQLRQASASGAAGEKVILFCEFRDLQTLLQRVIQERFGISASVVNGETSASLEVDNSRQKLIDRFQQTSGFNVIILSPLAVGFGVNIQAANHVIHFTRTWNPAKEDQATDRAYRIGQERDVTVYYPSVVNDNFKSFDMVLDGLLTWKRGIAQDMLNASGDLSVADFEGLEI